MCVCARARARANTCVCACACMCMYECAVYNGEEETDRKTVKESVLEHVRACVRRA